MTVRRWFLYLILAVPVSCSEKTGTADFSDDPVNTTFAEVFIEDFIDTGDTKTAINSLYVTTWDESDYIGIFPYDTSASSSQDNPQLKLACDPLSYPVYTFTSATGWNFAEDKPWFYVAYHPYSVQCKSTSIEVDYSGQVQAADGATSHLGSCDYLVSYPVRPACSYSAAFTVHHLGAVAHIKLAVPDDYNGCKFSCISLEADSPIFVPGYSFSISDIVRADSPTISSSQYRSRLSMSLNDISTADSELDVYMMMHPSAVKNHGISVKLHSSAYPYTVLAGDLTCSEDQSAGYVYHYEVQLSPKDFLPELPSKPDEGNLNILVFGHSYAMNYLSYLPGIINAAGITNIHLGQMHDSNCSLKTHLSRLTGGTAYYYHDFPPGQEYYNNSLRTSRSVLEETPWDIIIFQPSIGYTGAAEYSLFQSDLKKIISEVGKICSAKHGKTPAMGFAMLWSYDDHLMLDLDRTDEMYRDIVDATQMMQDDMGLDIVIPLGTSIQNLRHSSLCVPSVRLFLADNVHASAGIGCYAAASTVFEYLIKPIYGTGIESNSFTPGRYTSDVDRVTSENTQLIRRSVVAAVKQPYNLSDID